MTNSCESCERKCCKDFAITTEIRNPVKLEQTLKEFPFIKKTGSKLVSLGGREIMVGIYNCDRFNEEDGKCNNYQTEPRPDFCINTGVQVAPKKNCPLYNKG